MFKGELRENKRSMTTPPCESKMMLGGKTRKKKSENRFLFFLDFSLFDKVLYFVLTTGLLPAVRTGRFCRA
jgi:hypothetical protein